MYPVGYIKCLFMLVCANSVLAQWYFPTKTPKYWARASYNLQVRSRLECMTICEKNMCGTFVFNKTTNVCTIEARTDGTEDVWQRYPTCPSSLGYADYVLDGVAHCLKFTESPTINAWKQRTACKQEGAHLILIESRAMLDDLKVVLVSFGYGGELFIEGRNWYKNGTWYFDDKEVPFIEWVSGSNTAWTQSKITLWGGGGLYHMSGGYGPQLKKTLCQIY